MCCNRPPVVRVTARVTSQRLSQPAAPQPQPQRRPQAAPQTPAPLHLPTPVFEYVGATALTVVSPVTRNTYRFDKPGARVAIDPRDRSWMAFVPNLVAA